ncbi:VQ motif [Musa troglodytarum]|nr:VQ motif [Musa troglodytarum]
MRFTTSVAKFRALVQKLTGRDSNVGDTGATSMVFDGLVKPSAQPAPGSGVASDRTGMDPRTATASVPFEMFDDDVFTPEMLDNFPGLQQSTPFVL